MKILFRFQTLDIWHLANEIGDELMDVADELEKRSYYRFAEQLRASSLSESNNIAEEAGSDYSRDFRRFLNDSRRSTFENANVVFTLRRRGLISEAVAEGFLARLVVLSRKLTRFKQRL